MAQKKEIVIHIGHFKTATSSIQHLFYHNRKQLRKQGILYPDTGRPLLIGAKITHLLLSESLLYETDQAVPDWYSHKFSSEKIYKNLQDEIESSKCSRVFISSESYVRLSSSDS
jgi:hypothetical protein